MRLKKYQRYRLLITLVIAVLIVWSVLAEISIIIPLVGIAAGMLTLFLLKKRVVEVIEDERNYCISEKAARAAISIFAPLLGVSTVVLSSGLFPEYKQAAYTLAFTGCVLMVLFYAFYLYHERKC